MKPAQADESPFKERPGNGSPPAKVQYIAQIFIGAGDGWNGDRIQHLQRFGTNKEARARFTGTPGCYSENIDRLGLSRLAWIGNNIDGVVQRYNIKVVGIVRYEYRAKKGAARAHPVISSMQRIAVRNLLGGLVLGVAVLLIFELSLAIGVRSIFISEASWPCRERIDGAPVLQDRGVNVNYIAVVELQLFADGQPFRRILEYQIRRRSNGAIFGGDIESRIQLIAQRLVVAPERERIPVFASSRLVDDVERPTLIIRIFFQDPRFRQPAAIRESDAIKIVLNYRFGFGLRLLG